MSKVAAKNQLQGTQAARVFRRFGGVPKLAEALRAAGRPRALSSLYRWNMPAPKGTGGLVPRTAIDDVLCAAVFDGVELTAEDLDPRTGIIVTVLTAEDLDPRSK